MGYEVIGIRKIYKMKKFSSEEIKTINDLEELLGKEKVAELFMQHYIKLSGSKLGMAEDLKGQDLFNIG